jgi:ABC-type sugar transport system ATPase subunit
VAEAVVRFDGVSKSFPGVLALKAMSFEVGAGACHALCGENGAGKSTLARLLAGVHSPDSGRIFVLGRQARFENPREALEAGVAMVHQELAVCGNLSVAENLCLGQLPARGFFVRRQEVVRRARQMLEAVGCNLDVRLPAGSLSPGQQQMVQVAAAASSGARVMIFDEPTSSLSEYEAGQLEDLITRLRAQGVTCLYVSHRMREIFRLCDNVTVLRDGQHVVTRPLAGLDEGGLVQMMIGRTLEPHVPEHLSREPGPELLRLESLSSPGKFNRVSLSLHAGEVLGVAGLVGAGRSELAQALFGLDSASTGRVYVHGTAARIRRPAQAMRLGLGLVPEERQRQGLVLPLGARTNTTLPILEGLARAGFVRGRAEARLVQDSLSRLRVRAPGLDFPVAGLSGGNQQKIVLAKWLAARCRILILDEPTRGVDVGAKAEIHALVDRLASDGHGVLLISSELPELLALSTRVLVLRGGELAGELPRLEATEEAVMRLMAGVGARPIAVARPA